MSPIFHGTLVSLSVTPTPDPVTVVTLNCRVEWLLDGPWEVKGRLVVNRETGAVVRPTKSAIAEHDPYHLAEALNRVYLGLPRTSSRPASTEPAPDVPG